MDWKEKLRAIVNDRRFLYGCIGCVVVVILRVFVFSGLWGGKDDSVPVDSSEETLPAYYPFTSREVKEAYDKNNDVVGWLSFPGCELDNPVFQGDDNDEYLRVNEEGEYDIWGCYFLDYINKNDGYSLRDKVNIIYGHSLDDVVEEDKFSKLKRLKEEDFALENKTINFSLLYRDMEWEIFAVADIPITIDYIDPNPEDEDFRDTIEYMTKHSYVDFGTEVGTDDRILILSTCTSDEDVRFVVAAKLVSTEANGSPDSASEAESGEDSSRER